MAYLGFMKRKNCLVLTWFGWIVLLALIVGAIVLVIRTVHPFLAVNHRIETSILVVEGWLPDDAIEEALREFMACDYHMIITTGGPLERGFHLSEYKTHAQLAAATLRQLGLEEEAIVAVPAPSVRKDRTYAAAIALREWLSSSGFPIESLNVCSLGPHARRSWLIFQKALGRNIDIGIISARNVTYDPSNWWRSSKGVRTVVGEMVAYLYARFFFYPRE